MPENFGNEPQYGDQTQLAQAGLGQRELPISQGARPARAGGRPAGTSTPQPSSQPQDAAPGEAIPDEHRALIRQYVETRDAREKLEVASGQPGTPMWIPFYATVARLNEALLARRIKQETPDFDVEDPELEQEAQPNG